MADQEALARAQQEEEQRQQMEERKQIMLQSLLTPEAKERRQQADQLSRIALVKPEKAAQLSDQLLSMAQRGAITEKVSEQRLKQMLESTSEGNTSRTPKITFQRKKYADSDEDEEYDV